MELKIGSLVKEENIKESYIIRVEMMHGDADGYTTGEVIIPADKEELVKDVLLTLKTMKELPWNGARQKYNELPGFLAWFGSEYLGIDEEDEESEADPYWDPAVTYDKWEEMGVYSFEWESDYTYREINARLESYEVFYADEHGLKHHVEVIY